jgi:diguanylate cyclase (GGDEF)-like protein
MEAAYVDHVTPSPAGLGAVFVRMADLWRASDRYSWLTEYLSARGLETRIRATIVLASIGYSALPLSMVLSPSGPRDHYAKVITVVAASCVAVSSLMFIRRWPSRAGAVAFAFIADAATAYIYLNYQDPLVGLVGCVLFAVIGGYIAVFHCTYVQVVNLVVGLVVATVLGVSLWQSSRDAVLAFNVYVAVVITVAAISMGGHVLVHFFGLDLAAADTDPLTGLLNRRAFDRQAQQLLAAHSLSTPAELCVTMIDIDRFKQLNDIHGHAVGDAALKQVSTLIKDMTLGTAIVARAGGEEFVVVEIGDLTDTTRRASNLCAAIAATEFRITASIGVASAVTPFTASDLDRSAVISQLIETADKAMYSAKRAGGSRVGIQRDPH